MITLKISGPTAFKVMPNIKADIYFGGRIPANPAIELLKIAIQMPKSTIMTIEQIQATSSGRKYTMIGRAIDRLALKKKQKKIRLYKGIEFWYLIVMS